jgi:predicted DNA-binding protein (MmcQ/YjbR family)
MKRESRNAVMKKQEFLSYCLETYGTSPDYPFDEDFETAVLRHVDTRKWYALAMKVSRRKFGQPGDEIVDVVNMKLPTEMIGSFGTEDGVHPAYHMNKLHWISVILPDAPEDVVRFLLNVSFEATRYNKKRKKI